MVKIVTILRLAIKITITLNFPALKNVGPIYYPMGMYIGYIPTKIIFVGEGIILYCYMYTHC
jgi:hypothetical protein